MECNQYTITCLVRERIAEAQARAELRRLLLATRPPAPAPSAPAPAGGWRRLLALAFASSS